MHEHLLHGGLWNLFLAAIPVGLGYLLGWGLEGKGKSRRMPPFVWIPLALVWFAFVPNTCYLLTEWRHPLFDEYWRPLLVSAKQDRAAMVAFAKWALLFLAYSGVGVLLYVLSIRPVEAAIRRAKQNPLLLAPPFFLLVSLGVYLGLIDRLNSWNVIDHPRWVWESILDVVTSEERVVYVVVFAAILWLLYEAVDLWIDAFKARIKRGRT